MDISAVTVQDLAQSLGLSLISVPIPVPPSPLIERAVGYQKGEEARFLALWWEPCCDEVMVSDGLISFTGHWPGYLTYVQHQRVYPSLVGYNLGSSECEADLHLVIDRKERTAYIVPANQAGKLLSYQWEREGRPDLPQIYSFEDLEDVIQKIVEQWRPPSNSDVLVQMKADRAAVQALKDWLDHPTE